MGLFLAPSRPSDVVRQHSDMPHAADWVPFVFFLIFHKIRNRRSQIAIVYSILSIVLYFVHSVCAKIQGFVKNICPGHFRRCSPPLLKLRISLYRLADLRSSSVGRGVRTHPRVPTSPARTLKPQKIENWGSSRERAIPTPLRGSGSDRGRHSSPSTSENGVITYVLSIVEKV